MNTANTSTRTTAKHEINYDCYMARGRALRSQAIREAFLGVSRRFLMRAERAGKVRQGSTIRLPDCAAA